MIRPGLQHFRDSPHRRRNMLQKLILFILVGLIALTLMIGVAVLAAGSSVQSPQTTTNSAVTATAESMYPPGVRWIYRRSQWLPQYQPPP